MTNTIRLSRSPRVELSGGKGKISIIAADVQQISGQGAADVSPPDFDGVTRLNEVNGDLALQVPFGTSVAVERHEGDLRIEGVETVQLRDVVGSVDVRNSGRLVIDKDTERFDFSRLWKRVRRDVSTSDVRDIRIAAVHDRLRIERAEHAIVGPVGGEARVVGVSGELELGPVGGSCEVGDCGSASVGPIGGSVRVRSIEGGLRLSHIGGTAEIHGVGALLHIGSVGGSLNLVDAPLEVGGALQIMVGGSARIELPAQPNMTVHVTLGGRLTAPRTNAGAGMHRVVFGSGEARMSITAGGSVTLVEAQPVAV